jgi:mannose/fructose/N-acetylgalactosamine-specific phosphotransferase system component IIB
MIKTLRIDERLIHGQVVGTWCNALSLNRLVIANDAAATDEIRKMAMKVALPSQVKAAICTVEDAIVLLQDPRMDAFAVMILTANTKDALRVVQSVKGIPYVTLGNIGLAEKESKKQIGTSVFVSEQDVEDLKKIVELLPNSIYQMTPANPPVKIADLI